MSKRSHVLLVSCEPSASNICRKASSHQDTEGLSSGLRKLTVGQDRIYSPEEEGGGGGGGGGVRVNEYRGE